MLGTMMDDPLLLSGILEQAAEIGPDTEIVGRDLDGVIRRYTMAAAEERVRKLARALQARGVRPGDRIASIGWSTRRHFELFHAIPGIGAVLHTVSPRLTPEDMAYVINEADDRWLFVDAGTLELAEKIVSLIPRVSTYVYMDAQAPANSRLPGLVSQDELIAASEGPIAEWPTFDERQAAVICFTSGTTGKPKGVAYTHRSTMIAALAMSLPDMVGSCAPGSQETFMPIAPLFHANGWQMPYTAPLNGHRLVLPGRALDAASLVELIRSEGVTVAAGVPTLWNDIVRHLDATGLSVPTLRAALVAGMRLPSSLYDAMARHGIAPFQSWGMTEAPGVMRASPPPGSSAGEPSRYEDLRKNRQGRRNFCTRMRLLDEDGNIVARDGVSVGRLYVRGPMVTARYLGQPESAANQWLDTGDLARIYRDGTVEIVDRLKDVIKSGGEWISTPDIEAAAASHPEVELCAAIAAHHEKWQERPVLLCVLRAGSNLTDAQLLAHMATRLPRWCVPDAVRFVDRLPLTATGKIDKVSLRKTFGSVLVQPQAI